MSFTQRSGKLRLYDGTATPFFLELAYDAGDLSAPIGVPSTEEQLKLDRGLATSDMHFIRGPESKVWEPTPISFSAMITWLAKSEYLLQWLEWQSGGAATINSNSVVTTKGTTMRDGVNTCPAFADPNKRACNLEIFYTETNGDQGWQYNEVHFPLDQCNFSESEEAVSLAVSGLCYGSIARITAFTSGTDISAAA